MSFQARTPAEWMHMMQQDNPHGRMFVAHEARRFLTGCCISNMATVEVAASLWPPQHAIGEGIALRKRMVTLLMKCAADELNDCTRRGPAKERKFMGRTIYPWLWSTPKVQAVIPIDGVGGTDGAAPEIGTPISQIKWAAGEPKPRADRDWLVSVMRATATGQMMPAFKLGDLADEILRKAKVIPV